MEVAHETAVQPDEIAVLPNPRTGRTFSLQQGITRRHQNPFQLFVDEERPRLKEKGMKIGEMQKAIATKWDSMDEREKDKYNEMYFYMVRPVNCSGFECTCLFVFCCSTKMMMMKRK